MHLIGVFLLAISASFLVNFHPKLIDKPAVTFYAAAVGIALIGITLIVA